MIKLNFFYYFQKLQAVDGTDITSLRNLPMYNNTIKVYKRTSTKIALTVRLTDRRALRLNNETLYYLNILSVDGKVLLLRKQFEQHNLEKGILLIDILPTELEHIKLGRYYYSITSINLEGNEYPLYLDQNAGATGDIEVLEHVLPLERVPFVQFHFLKIRTWTEGTDGKAINPTVRNSYVSSRLPIINKEHTLTIVSDGFTGKILLQKTRDMDPNQQESWETFETIEYDNETMAEAIVLEMDKTTFVRVLFHEDLKNAGSIKEIQYI